MERIRSLTVDLLRADLRTRLEPEISAGLGVGREDVGPISWDANLGDLR